MYICTFVIYVRPEAQNKIDCGLKLCFTSLLYV